MYGREPSVIHRTRSTASIGDLIQRAHTHRIAGSSGIVTGGWRLSVGVARRESRE